jgi:hypothetical protein
VAFGKNYYRFGAKNLKEGGHSMNAAISGHYLGESGRAYFKWQSQIGALDGEIEAHKFERYIKPTMWSSILAVEGDSRLQLCIAPEGSAWSSSRAG